ncbi:MAG: sodium:calcium antiporter, partial [Bacteroidaceae bacterium]|nr:sodium:calcium antiporter [Bacteroidaceae bacterium]
MLISIVKLVLGAAFILLGADMLTNGATQIARKLKISELLIGLTIVAMGTSLPELTVSVISAINGKAEMAVGNVIGSNIFNTLVILGTAALLCPVRVSRQVIAKDIPWSILAGVVLLIAASGRS